MKLKTATSVYMLVMALGITSVSAEAGQRDSRGRERNPRSQTQSRPSGGNSGAPRAVERQQVRPVQRQPPTAARQVQPRGFENRVPPRQTAPGRAQAVPRYDQRSPDRRGYDNGSRDAYRDNRSYSYNARGYYPYRAAPRYYGAPRVVVPVPVYPRHYYGPGGNLSVYFGWGNGYRYGAPWSGRVYGYAPPVSYGARVYYGDVRLQVRPSNAAVYVDGYYAGVVDDFDGIFQRLTIEVGPHQIELDAPGLQPHLFDIYVDPARTVTLHADLY